MHFEKYASAEYAATKAVYAQTIKQFARPVVREDGDISIATLDLICGDHKTHFYTVHKVVANITTGRCFVETTLNKIVLIP